MTQEGDQGNVLKWYDPDRRIVITDDMLDTLMSRMSIKKWRGYKNTLIRVKVTYAYHRQPSACHRLGWHWIETDVRVYNLNTGEEIWIQ
jgi:Leu/Phe-tRNA-protein transferase